MALDSNSSGTSPKTKTVDNDQPDHVCDWDYLTMHTILLLPLILCLFKAKAEDELSAYERLGVRNKPGRLGKGSNN
jgi:hypothetical protein